MSALPVTKTENAPRALVIARIERDRAALVDSVHALRRPMQVVDHWQGIARAVLPVVPMVLAAGAIAFVGARLLRRGYRVPGGGWLGLALQLANAYRIARRLGVLNSSGPTPVASYRSSSGTKI